MNYYDPEGNFAGLIIGALIGGLISGGVNILCQVTFENKSFDEIEWGKAGISFVSGVMSGLVPGSGIFSMIGQAAVSSVVDNVLMYAAYGDELSFKDVMTDFCLQVVAGLALKGLGKITCKATNKIFNKGNNYSLYQHYFRSKGLNYSKDEVYILIYKYGKYMRATDKIIGRIFEFGVNYAGGYISSKILNNY